MMLAYNQAAAGLQAFGGLAALHTPLCGGMCCTDLSSWQCMECSPAQVSQLSLKPEDKQAMHEQPRFYVWGCQRCRSDALAPTLIGSSLQQ